jgi:hypothetical protein
MSALLTPASRAISLIASAAAPPEATCRAAAFRIR